MKELDNNESVSYLREMCWKLNKFPASRTLVPKSAELRLLRFFQIRNWKFLNRCLDSNSVRQWWR